MNDLISRQAAIDAVLGACKDTATTECAVRELEELPPAQPNLRPTCNQLAIDCIGRQAAISALKDNVIEIGGDDFAEKGVHEDDIDAIIDKLPSVHPDLAQLLAYECGKASAQPEIIRCNDCEYYKSYTLYGQTQGFCNRLGLEVVELDDFCSKAERRK